MSSLSCILAATLLGGALSVLLAGVFAFVARPAWVPRLVSFAVGTLLGAVFLEILPHALEYGEAQSVAASVLAGLLAWPRASCPTRTSSPHPRRARTCCRKPTSCW